MKQTIHTTACHPAFVIPTEVEGTQKNIEISPFHCITVEMTKTVDPELTEKPTWSCRACRDILSSHYKTLLFTIFFFLFSFLSQAQTYDWDWAISGGGIQGVDQIYDVKVGSDNHYYFIGSMHGTIGVQLDGYSVDVYNSSLGGDDIFLFSTTCDGQVRWSQAIGGSGTDDSAYNLVLDTNDNVYVGVRVGLATNPLYPVHFSPIETLPPIPSNPTTVSDGWKTSFIVKYNSNGQYQWKKAVQGNVTQDNFESRIHDIVMDSQNNLHFIVGFAAGTHLDGLVTVPNNFTNYTYQYYLVKLNTVTQQFENVLLLLTTGYLEPQHSRFGYDEISNTYYISSTRESLLPFSFDNKSITNRSFILAFNGTNGGIEWLREIYSQPINGLPIQTNRIYSLVVDENSDIYIGGNIYKSPNETNLKIYDPTDAAVTSYLFTPGADFTIPMIAKLNSSGAVQWVQATAAYSSGVLGPAPRYGKGIAINGNEVAFGVQGGGDFWDAIEIVRPIINYQPDPLLIRFNKQTGAVINVHEIKGEAMSTKQMTAVATDNDGNYITGGIFNSNLFMNNTMGITPLVSAGDYDFFVAKLAASVCGTPVSTDKFNKLSVNVYPNPTNGIVTIETAETLSSYRVYDMQGRSVQNGLFSSTNQVNLQNVATGTYFIQVHTVQGVSTATVKVVKE